MSPPYVTAGFRESSFSDYAEVGVAGILLVLLGGFGGGGHSLGLP